MTLIQDVLGNSIDARLPISLLLFPMSDSINIFYNVDFNSRASVYSCSEPLPRRKGSCTIFHSLAHYKVLLSLCSVSLLGLYAAAGLHSRVPSVSLCFLPSFVGTWEQRSFVGVHIFLVAA